MKAFAIEQYGGPEVLALRRLPEPEPGPGDLLVEVRAASVNPVDVKIRNGEVKVLVKDRFPLTLGCDLSDIDRAAVLLIVTIAGARKNSGRGGFSCRSVGGFDLYCLFVLFAKHRRRI